MVRVYIRHARKAYFDGQQIPLHDPEAIINQQEIIKIVTILVRKYGLPDRIIISPYLRTRMTADSFMNIIDQFYHVKVPYIIDCNISEYIGYRKLYHPEEKLSVTQKTFDYDVPGTDETKDELLERIDDHDDMFRNSEENIWIISHGKIMGILYEKYIKIKRKPFDFLDSFSLK